MTTLNDRLEKKVGGSAVSEIRVKSLVAVGTHQPVVLTVGTHQPLVHTIVASRVQVVP